MKIALVIIGVLIGIGCGIKGPPLPPIETINDRANNMNADEPAAAASASGDTTTKTSGDNTTIQKAKKK